MRSFLLLLLLLLCWCFGLEQHVPVAKKKRMSWDEGYALFVAFVEREGHGVVPLSTSPLGKWVRNQRKCYRRIQTGKKTRMLTNHRIKLLNEAGFVWDVAMDQWMTQYKKLVEFSNKHHHTRVPSNITKYKVLSQWIIEQRMQHNRILEKRTSFGDSSSSPLTQERIDLLNKIQFCWSLPNWYFTTRVTEAKEAIRERPLHDWRKTHGELGVWICFYKQEYRKHLQQRQNVLTQDQIDILENDLGFTNESVRLVEEKPSESIDWEDALERLERYKKKHGNMLIPSNTPLGSIARYIRSMEKKSMNRTRLERLDRMGFVWDTAAYGWKMRFRALQDFRAEMGHVHVPSTYGTLGTWVQLQRRRYRQNKLPPEHVLALSGVGFDFYRGANVRKKNEETFRRRVAEFNEFIRTQHNNTLPPSINAIPCRSTVYWIKNQREDYRHWLEGKTSPCRDKTRRLLLESTGLVDDLKKQREPEDGDVISLRDGLEYDDEDDSFLQDLDASSF